MKNRTQTVELQQARIRKAMDALMDVTDAELTLMARRLREAQLRKWRETTRNGATAA